ncbi:nucleotidyl transferase AbiEii/AbiGii toxin family protein [Thermobifida halotolerans]|uniref:Nucleotidyl transferase AbiEii/AbiGii toxin family protein n=1 Tax=Thermobifida halotolerans TaxID=483545 RepID=A0A399FZ76_9ACTN|nr:nucleotidyl transferase AbiEii/AbiGii toxin family protein [Thermobifida halotolerans]UOE18535.1 nucleotidyl transferase AbiEii/AbiGii toxin family protein [Thermobifida halotolerans]
MDNGAHSYTSFWRELNEKVQEHARRRGTSPRSELHQWVLQRVMVRLFDTQPDDWVVKGGQTLLARWPDARSTGDVDLVSAEETTSDTLVNRYNHALSRDYGDYLTFVPDEIDRGIMGTGKAARMRHIAYFGDMRLMEVQTDAVPPDSRPKWKGLEQVPFPEQIHGSGTEQENPDLRILSAHDALLHKITGIFMKTWRGEAPVRSQDLVDTLFLADRLALDGPEAHAMLQKEIAYQHSQHDRLAIPDRFEVPNPAWREGFAQHAESTPGLPYKTLDQAVPAAQRFLDPLLAAEPPQADWDPQRRQWVERSAQDSRGTTARQEQNRLTALDHPRGAAPDIGAFLSGQKGRSTPSRGPRQTPGQGQDGPRRRGPRSGA